MIPDFCLFVKYSRLFFLPAQSSGILRKQQHVFSVVSPIGFTEELCALTVDICRFKIYNVSIRYIGGKDGISHSRTAHFVTHDGL